MKWRCEWCGKPHEENDPPCGNCGHGTFERAVVQQANEQDSTTVWVCTDCGREHTKHSPPCSRCGTATLERREKVITEENLTERPGSASTGSVDTETTTLWVCPDCGNEHTKNTPPCNRCGTATLERETKTIDDDELATPGYLDLITPKYAAVLGVVLLIAVVFGLGVVGVVDLPFFPDNSVPDVDDVPGNESAVNGIAIDAVESEYVETVNRQRRSNGLSVLERDGRLDKIARFDNRQRIRAAFGDGTVDEATVRDRLVDECTLASEPQRISVAVTDDDTTASLANQFAVQFGTGAVEASQGQLDSIGVHMHAVDGELYLDEILCER